MQQRTTSPLYPNWTHIQKKRQNESPPVGTSTISSKYKSLQHTECQVRMCAEVQSNVKNLLQSYSYKKKGRYSLRWAGYWKGTPWHSWGRITCTRPFADDYHGKQCFWVVYSMALWSSIGPPCPTWLNASETLWTRSFSQWRSLWNQVQRTMATFPAVHRNVWRQPANGRAFPLIMMLADVVT